jgi:uncharacterized protein YerC
MRRSSIKLNPSLKNQITKTLAQAIADMSDYNEVHLFLKDFFTEAELETYSKRLAVAYWLKKKKSYVNIKNDLKVSSATIADISSDMNKKGFKLAIKKIEAEEWANQWADKIKKYTNKFGGK